MGEVAETYNEASQEIKVLYWVFAITRIIIFFYYAIINAVQWYHEQRADKETRSWYRIGVYIMCTVLSLTRSFAFVLKFYYRNLTLISNSPSGILYTILIIVGTYSILIQWCLIGRFWISTFYMFFHNHDSVLDKRVRRRVDIIVNVTMITITIWVLIMIFLFIFYSGKSIISLVYNAIYLLVVLYTAGIFTYHGIVLSKALEKFIKSNQQQQQSNIAAQISHKKTSFLVKVLASISILAIIRSFLFTFVIPDPDSFGMESIGDFIAMILELAQMTSVMLTMSLGSLKEFILFKRSFKSPNQVYVMNQNIFKDQNNNKHQQHHQQFIDSSLSTNTIIFDSQLNSSSSQSSSFVTIESPPSPPFLLNNNNNNNININNNDNQFNNQTDNTKL